MTSVLDRSSEQNKESITLIWFDASTNGKVNTAETAESLRLINDYVLIQTNEKECFFYIKAVTDEKIFLVVSGASAHSLLPLVTDLKQLELVFVLCDVRERYLSLMEKYSKIVNIFTNRQDLYSTIRKHIQSSNKQMHTFSFYDQKQTVSMDLTERTAEFLWFQLIHDVILCLPSSNQAKQQMISACRDYYQGNDRELRQIDDFERTYSREKCIQWYTRETFVYKLVNKALRTEDVEQLHIFRFYISDLSSTLAYEHKKFDDRDADTITTVYRGSRLTKNELEQFRSNEGRLISINGYLSASRLQRVAFSFTGDTVNRKNTLPVLFEIRCEGEDNSGTIFADVSKLSDFPEEEEVLFDLGAVFEVDRVSEEDGLWKISLSATDEGRAIARQYIEETKKEMQGDSVVILFGRLMTRMGHYKSAEIYFQQLLVDPGADNPAHIHHQLGLVYQAKAEYGQAMRHFDTAYQLMNKSRPPFLRDAAHVLRSMSQVLREEGKYAKALEYCIRAKQILEKVNDSGELEMGHCLHSMGSCYRDEREFSRALDLYEEALHIKRACLSENHVYIAKTLNSIGLTYLMTKDFEKAFNYYLSCLEMYQMCLPEDHPDIANALHNIAQCYQDKKQLGAALQHYHLALTIREKCYSSDHPSTALTLNNISSVYSAKGDKDKALEFGLRALGMRERVLPFNHPDLAASLYNVGFRYEAMNDNQQALKYFEQALTVRKTFLPQGHPLFKMNETCIFRVKLKLV